MISCEPEVLSARRNGSDCIFDQIVIDFQHPIFTKQCEQAEIGLVVNLLEKYVQKTGAEIRFGQQRSPAANIPVR
jgi:hypothetical protein